MLQPTLVILSAGMGSRFGGLKQIKAVDDRGHAIIDFSLYDAYRAGFRKVVFVIKHEIEEDFKNAVGRRMEKYFDVRYVYQQLDRIPAGCAIPEGRVKPWGTGHAVACCADAIDGPFAVINADDFYGSSAYTEDGEHFVPLSGGSPVSMNCWAFGRSMLDELVARFGPWFAENVEKNPLKAEYFLPSVANALIQEGLATVRVLPCSETWYGITYKEDLPNVIDAIAALRKAGVYPETLLD